MLEDQSNDLANVSFPASSPYTLACGGSALRRSSGKFRGEDVWNRLLGGVKLATGGGISGRFAAPDYQDSADVRLPSPSAAKQTWLSSGRDGDRRLRARGIPDVTANADFTTGYQMVIGGSAFVGGGTSAVAPLWAALIARLNESLGFRLGWANPIFYRAEVARTFRTIARGNNDVANGRVLYYRARRGWNGCTGLGSPDGERLLAALRALAR
jgi:kumamolisin